MPIHRQKPAACKHAAQPATATTQYTPSCKWHEWSIPYNYVIQSDQYLYINCSYKVNNTIKASNNLLDQNDSAIKI